MGLCERVLKYAMSENKASGTRYLNAHTDSDNRFLVGKKYLENYDVS